MLTLAGVRDYEVEIEAEIADTDFCCDICDYTVWEGEETIEHCHAACYMASLVVSA